MGETEILIDIVARARTDLQKAQAAAKETKRPPDACPAHDVQFALSQALSGALDTLLMLKQEEMRDRSGGDTPQGAAVGRVVAVARALAPFRWPAAVAIFSPFAGDVAAKVLAFFK